MVRSSSYKQPCYRGNHSHNEDGPQQEGQEQFFSARRDNPAPARCGAFFQTKGMVNSDTALEKEADSTADKVVSKKENTAGAAIEQKDITGIQRLATRKEDDNLGTNDARMLRDKQVQEKPEQQRTCPDCEEDKSTIQTKSETGSGNAGAALSNSIQSKAGKGKPLPADTRAEMQTAFNADFSNVNIHNDTDAVTMNRQLQAQAFTHGNDIFFNSGKYDPKSTTGKRLLAHELTHVVQQGGVQRKEATGIIQPYRPKEKASFNYGVADTPDLKEGAFDATTDQTRKPWIQDIYIHFNQIVTDTDGDIMPKGIMVAVYNINGVQPAVPVMAMSITGGKNTEMYTHPGNHKVTRIKGIGYHNANERGNEGPGNRYKPASTRFDSNMSFAIFFHNGEAIHRGALDIGSHGCVHVDWGGENDDGDLQKLRQLNYHSVIGLTNVHVSYDPTILPGICCALYRAKGKKKGKGDEPCNTIKAQSCP